MIERKLSKPQTRVFIALARQRNELQAAFQEVLDAEKDQIEMLREHYELPEGEYQVQLSPDGEAVLRFVEPPKEPEPKKGQPKKGQKKEVVESEQKPEEQKPEK